MAHHDYIVRRKSPSLAYEAVEKSTGHAILLNPQQGPSPAAGSYPDIEAHLTSHHGLKLSPPGLAYEEKLGDTFDQAKSTWTYKRGAETITVVDGPRTVAEGFIYPPT